MHVSRIHMLYQYNRWANSRVLDATERIPPAQFTQEIVSSYRSVRDTLVHILSGEWIWLQRWQGRSPSTMFNSAEFPTLHAVRMKWAEVEREQQAFLETLTEGALERVIAYRNLAGEEWRYPLWQMLQHVVNHSSYHRGQVTTLLRQVGALPVATDFLVFIDAAGGASG